MILYNVTVNIEQTVEIQWIEWMKNHYIHSILNTGCFVSARFSRLTSHTEPDSTNYVVQFLCENNIKLNEYKNKFEPNFKSEYVKKYGDKMQTFNTELEVLDDLFPHQN